MAGLIAGIFREKNTYTEVNLNSTTKFSYPVYDSYWACFIHLNKIYEQPLVIFLHKLSARNFCFIDCGANYGYWSAIMSSNEFNSHQCLAVEASAQSFAVLNKTASLNNKRFRCIHRALYCEDDKMIKFTEGGRHSGRHIINGAIEKLEVNPKTIFTPKEWIYELKTITLNSIAHDFFPAEKSFVIKLDVEGAEIDSIKGASELFDNAIFLYEDFGKDGQSLVTEYFLKENFEVYYPHQSGFITRIADVQQLKKIKNNKKMKYHHNLISVRSKNILADEVRQLCSGQ